jgi:hypothetical protein
MNDSLQTKVHGKLKLKHPMGGGVVNSLPGEKLVPVIKSAPGSPPEEKKIKTAPVYEHPIHKAGPHLKAILVAKPPPKATPRIATFSDLVMSNHINFLKTWYDNEKRMFVISTMIDNTSFSFVEYGVTLAEAMNKLAETIGGYGFEL